MQTTIKSSHPSPVLSQAKSNSTLWVGHLKTDPTDHFAGQTFTCPEEGQLDNIQLYPLAVQHDGQVQLTFHEFDSGARTWGPALGSASIDVKKSDHEKWLRFGMPHVPLHKNNTYGFRLQASEAMIGLGEAAAGTKHPFTFGHEWSADSKNQQGNYYSYFSLAFKVELC